MPRLSNRMEGRVALEETLRRREEELDRREYDLEEMYKSLERGFSDKKEG